MLRSPPGAASAMPCGRRLASTTAGHRRCKLIGTLCFNLSTFAATRAVATVQQQRRLIWSPDLAGSVCFLLASAAAWTIVSRSARAARDRDTTHRQIVRRPPRLIAGLNLAGSVAFGAAAIGARYLRTDGEIANIELVNLGTFLGAVCFFVGAALLPVDSARSAAHHSDASG